MPEARRALVVIGAGPVGLEAAALGRERGLDVTVLEAGRVGEGLRRWGVTRAFSPLSMNASPRLRALAAARPDDALLTGPELAVLLEEAATNLGCVRTSTRVLSVSRVRMSRDELAGHPIRAERRFRVVFEERDGQDYTESWIDADLVLDASGVAPAPLEVARARGASTHVVHSLGQLHDELDALHGKRVVVVGHGHSAAHAIHLLAPVSDVTWLVRTNRARPVLEVANDPLPERALVATRANDSKVRTERRVAVEHITRLGEALQLETNRGAFPCDALVTLVGQRPSLDHTRELALELAPATEGSARLWRAISNVTDCLNVPTVAPDALDSGEPGFHFIGSRSYGRARTFLLRTGLEQLETIFSRL